MSNMKLKCYWGCNRFLDVSKGIDTVKCVCGNNNILLLSAIKENKKDAVKQLISRGADVNYGAGVDNGTTPLMEAVLEANDEPGKKEIVKILIDNGADVNAADRRKRTPLMFSGRKDVIELLLGKGANINARNYDGRTVLHEEAKLSVFDDVSKESKELIRLFLSKGADPNIRDNSGRTPLMLATTRCNIDIARLLLDHGANVNERVNINGSVYTVLDFALNPTPLENETPEMKRKIAEFLKSRGAVPGVPEEKTSGAGCMAMLSIVLFMVSIIFYFS